MKAIILAAGKGKRLGNLIKETPKPMINILGKPVLEHNIELCKRFGITDIIINIHHLGHVIKDYFEDGTNLGVNIRYLIEENLHGTSGVVRKIAEEFWGYNTHSSRISHHVSHNDSIEPFFILYGDNFSNYNLNSLSSKSEETNSIATIAFHYRKDVSTSGVADFNPEFRILNFIEKPKPGETNSNWVNAGIYYLNPEILDLIPDGFSDFAKDIFPSLIRQNIPIYGVCDNSEVIAFDTPEMYSKNIKK